MVKKAIVIFAIICICIGITACNQQEQILPTEETESTEPIVLQPKEYNYYTLDAQGLLIDFVIRVDSKYSAIVTDVDELICAIEIKEGDKSLISGGTWQGIAFEKKEELLSMMLEGSTELEKTEQENLVYTFYKLSDESNSNILILVTFKSNNAFVVLETKLELDEVKEVLSEIEIR